MGSAARRHRGGLELTEIASVAYFDDGKPAAFVMLNSAVGALPFGLVEASGSLISVEDPQGRALESPG